MHYLQLAKGVCFDPASDSTDCGSIVDSRVASLAHPTHLGEPNVSHQILPVPTQELWSSDCELLHHYSLLHNAETMSL